MAESQRIYGGRWRVERRIGKGGQGIVYEVSDVGSNGFTALRLAEALAELNRVYGNAESRMRAAQQLTTLLDERDRLRAAPRAALKELLPIDEAVNAETALARMRTELEVLSAIKHPALIDVLDTRLDERWFVTEYFPNGTLASTLDRFIGAPLPALKAFRPLVSALSQLHRAKIVHRDFKPENVFNGNNDHLVLGDCGLAIKLEDADRITMTFENVGTRDYMPGWAYSLRVDEVRPTFDVFSAGKVLWAMLAGKPRFPLWYFERAPYDLRRQFPDDPHIEFIHRILQRCVVENEEDCLPNGSALLDEVDQAIEAIEGDAQRPSRSAGVRCTLCGRGRYKPLENVFTTSGFADPDMRIHPYRCDGCGRIENFMWSGDQYPPAWRD